MVCCRLQGDDCTVDHFHIHFGKAVCGLVKSLYSLVDFIQIQIVHLHQHIVDLSHHPGDLSNKEQGNGQQQNQNAPHQNGLQLHQLQLLILRGQFFFFHRDPSRYFFQNQYTTLCAQRKAPTSEEAGANCVLCRFFQELRAAGAH